ncbi:MAG: hypothetical protein H6832_15885 [Planctomycetes bacterium]|nr:hypothetical protein [Planctomycetota bacterium]MCB9919883.1 hypothetical protein [Planctomycetota bacterium]
MHTARIAIASIFLTAFLATPLTAAQDKQPPAGPDRSGGSPAPETPSSGNGKSENTETTERGTETEGKEASEDEGDSTDPKTLQRREAIRQRIQRERARRLATTVVRTHVSVRVRLRNGERLQGIVKDGNFVERPSGGLEFVRAEMTQKDAGLRLWYYNRTDGYIFLPYTMIETYKVLKRLTDSEIKVIHDEIREAERLARAAGDERNKQLAGKADAMKQGENAAEKVGELAAEIAAKKKKAEEDAAKLALIEEFPPDEGWGEERINQINIRRLTVRVFPNAKERRFIEVFDEWKKGRDLWLAKKSKDLGEKHDSAQKGGGTGTGTDAGKSPSGSTTDPGKTEGADPATEKFESGPSKR